MEQIKFKSDIPCGCDEIVLNTTTNMATFYKNEKGDDGSDLRTEMKTEEYIILILT